MTQLPQRTFENSNGLVDHAAQAADNAIKATQRTANEALDGLAGSVREARDEAAPLFNRATEQASAYAQRGVNALREGSRAFIAPTIAMTIGATLVSQITWTMFGIQPLLGGASAK